MSGWNYGVENVTGADARKIVTLEQDGMIWVGIRAYHYADKKWMNNGADSAERVVAWRDIPEPANPRIFAVPKEQIEEFERAMREDVIPKIEQDIVDRARGAAEARKHFIMK